MKQVIKNSSVLLLDKSINALCLFLLLIIMSSRYSQIEYGAYQYALTVGIIVGVLLQFSDEKVVKHLFHTNGPATVVFSTIVLKVILSLIVLLVYFLLIEISLVDDLISDYLLYFLLAAILVNLPFSMMVYFDYRLNSIKRAKAMIAGNTTAFLFQLFFILNGFSVKYVAMSVLIGAFVTSFAIVAMFLNLKLHIKKVINVQQIRNIFLRSVPFTLAAAAHMIYMRTDLIMIEYFMDFKEVAKYSVSMQLMSLMAILIYPLQVTFFPKLLALKDKGEKIFYLGYSNITTVLTWVGIFLAIVGVALVEPFVKYFIGGSYSSTINEYFYIHMLSAIIMYNAALRSSHITLIKKGYIILYSQVVCLLLNIVLNYFLIPKFGLQGAAFSTFFTILGSLLISNYFFQHTRAIFWIQLKAFLPKKNAFHKSV